MPAVTNTRSQVVMPPMEELAPFIEAGNVDRLIVRLVEAKVEVPQHTRFLTVNVDQGEEIPMTSITILRHADDGV